MNETDSMTSYIQKKPSCNLMGGRVELHAIFQGEKLVMKGEKRRKLTTVKRNIARVYNVALHAQSSNLVSFP